MKRKFTLTESQLKEIIYESIIEEGIWDSLGNAVKNGAKSVGNSMMDKLKAIGYIDPAKAKEWFDTLKSMESSIVKIKGLDPEAKQMAQLVSGAEKRCENAIKNNQDNQQNNQQSQENTEQDSATNTTSGDDGQNAATSTKEGI